MSKRLLIIIVSAFLLGSAYGQVFTADFAATHISGADSVLFSAISFVPCDQIQVRRFDARVTVDADSAHYGLTDFNIGNSRYAFRLLAFDVPSFKNRLDVDSVTFPIAMAELRFPFGRNAFRAGIIQGFIPNVTGSLEGQGVSFRHGDLLGGYAGFSRDDFSCVAYWGTLSGDVYASMVNLGAAKAHAGVVMAQWKRFGVFGAVVDGDTALYSNYLISFFTGHGFSIKGNLSARSVGLWGNAERSFGSVTAEIFGLAGFVWSSNTEIRYRDTWKEAGISQENVITNAADFIPAGIIVLYPSLSWRVNQTMNVRVSRLIPIAWGWNLERTDEGEGDDEGVSGSDKSLDGLTAETILLSGVTLSVEFAFR
jgi:hypothetical protein